MMKAKEADELGKQIAAQVNDNQKKEAYKTLAPILAERTPFRMLERIGDPLGSLALEKTNPFLEEIASYKTEGGWVVIGAALRAQLAVDLPGAFGRACHYAAAGDIWYTADILGERVPGPALLLDFESSYDLLAPWRTDPNRWVRRMVGVAVHFWAKRTKGSQPQQAQALLDLVEPLFSERQIDALKGIGWGLKTLGRYYPQQASDWLLVQVVDKQRPYRKLMLKKATTFLPPELCRGLPG